MTTAAPDFIADSDIDAPDFISDPPSVGVNVGGVDAPDFIPDSPSVGITGGIPTADFDTAAAIIDRPSPSALKAMAPDAQLATLESSRRMALRQAPFANTDQPDFIPDAESIPSATPGLAAVNPQEPGIIESASRGFAQGIPQAVGGVIRNVGRFDPIQRAVNATVGVNPANDLADYIAGGPDAIRDMTPAPSTITGNLAQGAAQYAPSIGAAMINPVAGAIVGGSQSAEIARQEVAPKVARGEVTPGQAAAYEVGTGAIGAVTGAIGGGLIRARDGYLATGILGGGLGGAQQAAQNAVTQQTIDPNRGVLDDVRAATAIGAGTAVAGKGFVDAFDGIFDRIWGSVRDRPQNATGSTGADVPPRSPPPGSSPRNGTENAGSSQSDAGYSSGGYSSRRNASQQRSDQPGSGQQARPRPRNTTAAEAEAFSWFNLSPDDAVDVDTVKAAWRAKAQQTHPDAGGDQGDFERTQQALQTVLRWMKANGRPQTAPGKAQPRPESRKSNGNADATADPRADAARSQPFRPGAGVSETGNDVRPEWRESVVVPPGQADIGIRPDQRGYGRAAGDGAVPSDSDAAIRDGGSFVAPVDQPQAPADVFLSPNDVKQATPTQPELKSASSVVAPGPAATTSPPGHADYGGSTSAARRPARSRRPPAKFTRAAIEQELLADPELHARHETADETEAMKQYGFTEMLTFRDKLPGEVRRMLEGNAWMRRHLRVAKTPQERSRAYGADALADLGEDRYLEIISRQLGIGRIDEAVTRAERSNDPRRQLLAAIHRNMPDTREKVGGKWVRNPELTKKEGVDPGALPTGSSFELNGSKFEIIEDAEGYRMLRDGDDYPVVPADYVGEIPADKGSVEVVQSDASEAGLPPESATAGDFLEGINIAPDFIPDADVQNFAHSRPDDGLSTPSTENPAGAMAKYDNGDFDSFGDFVDAIDATGEHSEAVDAYRREELDNRRLSGRNDMDAAEGRFVAAVRANAEALAAADAGKFTAPSSFKPFDADAAGVAAATQTGVFGQPVTLKNSAGQNRFEFEIERKPMDRPISRDETEAKIADQYEATGTPEMFEPAAPPPPELSKADRSLVAHLRKTADTLQKQIDDKRRPLTQNPTPKRNREYRSRVTEADLLERVQRAYRAIADARESGTLPPELSKTLKRAEITDLVRKKMASRGGYYDAHYETPEDERSTPAAKALQSLIENKSPQQRSADAAREKADSLRRLEDEVRFSPIEGFFPTPKPVIAKMMDLAEIEPGMKVLEPSAGKGDIADAMRDAGAEVDVVEINSKLRDILIAKGHGAPGDDFMQWAGQYDRIVMNPPFERGQDIEHVQRAYEMLKPGGRVVAVMSEGTFFRNDQKAKNFRTWLETRGGISEQMDEGSFAGADSFRHTGVRTRLVTIEKPGGQNPPLRPRNRSGMAYIGWLEPVVDAGRAVVQAGTAATRGAINIAVDDLIGRVRTAGTKSANEAADLANRALNTASAALGILSDDIAKAMKLTGAGMNPSLHRAALSLQRVKWVRGKDYGTAAIMDAVENNLTLGAAERHVVDSIRNLTDKLGRIYKANGHKQFDHKVQVWKPFNYIPGGNVFVRLQTPELAGAIMQGKGELWSKTIDAIADMNPQLANAAANLTARDVVERIFKEQRSAMLQSNEPGAFSRLNAEFRREIENMPTHIRIGSQAVEIIDSHPYAYVKRLAEHGAMRIGFVKHFGQELPGQAKIADLIKRYTDENGENKTLLDLLHSLSGVPVERPWIDPGTPLAAMVRNAQSVMSVAKSSLLSASMLTNIPEPLGNIQTLSERGDAIKALWKLLGSPKATIAALEHLGAITKDIADVTFDPARPLQSFARVLRDSSAKMLGHRWMNELQEKLAAATMLEKVQRMRAGNGTSGDTLDLAWLGFDINTARRMSDGQGTDAEYNDAVRRAPQKLVGSPMPAARKTRLSHNRAYSFAIAFENYAQMKVRSFLHLGQAWVDAAQRLAKAPTDRRTQTEFAVASLKIGRLILGTTAAGTAQYFIWAFALGGVEGLKIAGSEFQDRPAGFLRDSFMYTMFAGPYGALLRMASQNQGDSTGEAMVRATLPGFLIAETVDAVQGDGRYAGLSTMERMKDLAERLVPAQRVVKQLAVTMGFASQTSQEEHDLDTAVRAYWKWRYAEKRPGSFEEGDGTPASTIAIRDHMKRAYKRFRSFDSDGANAEMLNALEVWRANPGRGTAEANIRAKIRKEMLLRKLEPDEQLKLRNRIGEGAYRRLESHDSLLEAWAESIE